MNWDLFWRVFPPAILSLALVMALAHDIREDTLPVVIDFCD